MKTKKKLIKDIISEFVETAGRSKKTGKAYKNSLRLFVEHLAANDIQDSAPISTLTIDHALGFRNWLEHRRTKEGQELSLATRRLYHVAISRFYRRLILSRHIKADMQDYTNLREDLAVELPEEPIELKLPPDRMIELILEVTNEEPIPPDSASEKDRQRWRLIWLRDRAIVLTFMSTGMRVGELVSLRRGDLLNEDHMAWVKGKGQKKRLVRLSKEAWGAVWVYLDERQDETIAGPINEKPVFVQHNRPAVNRRLSISTRLVQKLCARLARRAGIAADFHFTPHTLRHYFATEFLEHTGNLALTQDILGHADPRTTRIYAKTSKTQIIQAHSEIFDE